MTRAEKAKDLFYQGYACSQSVVLAFSDIVDIDEKTLKKYHYHLVVELVE